MSVFLSYSTADRKLAEKLRAELKRQGVSVWVDAHEITPGENWQQRIEQAIRSAEDILVLVGPRNGPDEAQQFTWRTALEAVWQNPRLRLIPILVGDAVIPPFVYGDSSGDAPVIRISGARDLPQAARSLRSALRRDPPHPEGIVTDEPGTGTSGPTVTKSGFYPEVELERQNRLQEIRQYAESLKN